MELGGDTVVHIGRRKLIYVAERIFKRIFAHPYSGSELIAVEVFEGGLIGLIVGVGFIFHGEVK